MGIRFLEEVDNTVPRGKGSGSLEDRPAGRIRYLEEIPTSGNQQPLFSMKPVIPEPEETAQSLEERLRQEKIQKEQEKTAFMQKVAQEEEARENPENWTIEETEKRFKSQPAASIEEEANREYLFEKKKAEKDQFKQQFVFGDMVNNMMLKEQERVAQQGRVPQLRQASEEELSFIDRVKNKLGKMTKASEEERIAQAMNVYHISKTTGVPMEYVDKHLDEMLKKPEITGGRHQLTAMEAGSLAMVPLIGAGIVNAPLTTAVGLAAFGALDKVIDVKKFVPSDTADPIKKTVELADFVVKGAVTHKFMTSTMKAVPGVVEKVFQNKMTEIKAPQVVKLSRDKVASIFGSPKSGEKIAPEELEAFKAAGLSPKEIKTALKEGLDLEIPGEKIIRMVDKPGWAKFKEAVGIGKMAKLPNEKLAQALNIQRTVSEPLKGPELKPNVQPKASQAMPVTSQKPVEKGKELVSTELPRFKNTEEAVAFGEVNVGNKDMIKRLESEYLKWKKIAVKAEQTDDLGTGLKAAYEGQVYREAWQAAVGRHMGSEEQLKFRELAKAELERERKETISKHIRNREGWRLTPAEYIEANPVMPESKARAEHLRLVKEAARQGAKIPQEVLEQMTSRPIAAGGIVNPPRNVIEIQRRNNFSEEDLDDINSLIDWEQSQPKGERYSFESQEGRREFGGVRSGHSETMKAIGPKKAFDVLISAVKEKKLTPAQKRDVKLLLEDYRINIKPQIEKLNKEINDAKAGLSESETAEVHDAIAKETGNVEYDWDGNIIESNAERAGSKKEVDAGGEQPKEPLVMTEEEYLSSKGAPFMKGAEPALHRTPGGFPKGQREKLLTDVQEKMKANNEERVRLSKEYAEKVAKGEIRPPTRTERLIKTASGDESLASTQAARRLLKKQGQEPDFQSLEEPDAKDILKGTGKKDLIEKAKKYKTAEDFIKDVFEKQARNLFEDETRALKKVLRGEFKDKEFLIEHEYIGDEDVRVEDFLERKGFKVITSGPITQNENWDLGIDLKEFVLGKGVFAYSIKKPFIDDVSIEVFVVRKRLDADALFLLKKAYKKNEDIISEKKHNKWIEFLLKNKFIKQTDIDEYGGLGDSNIIYDNLRNIWENAHKESEIQPDVQEMISHEYAKSGGLPKEVSTKKRINKTQILQWAGKAFDVPIRGWATLPKSSRSAGRFYTKSDLIRLKRWGAIEELTHEIGHKIDKVVIKAIGEDWKISGLKKADSILITEELKRLDYEKKKGRISEGFAEFIRFYITTGLSKEKAPHFYKFFTENFLKRPENRQLARNLNLFKGKFNIWMNQGAEQRMLAQVDWKGEHSKLGIRSKIEAAHDWILKNFNDEFYLLEKIEKDIEAITGKKLKPSESPFQLATYAKSKASIKARTMIMDKTIDAFGNITGPGLLEVLEPVSPKDVKSFIVYMISERSINLFKRGIESGFDIQDAIYLASKYKEEHPGWEKVAKDVTDWSSRVLDYAIDAGRLGPVEAEVIRMLNPIYLPFIRAFLDSEALTILQGFGSFVNMGNALKAIKGSGRPTINPFESFVSQTTKLILTSDKARVARSIADLAEEEGLGGFIVEVPAPKEVRGMTGEKLLSTLRSLVNKEGLSVHIDDASGEKFVSMGKPDLGDLDNLDAESIVNFFYQGKKYTGKDNIVTIWKNGERKFYEIHPDLYKALSGMDAIKRGIILKILGPFARIQRLGATGLRVAFGLARNPFRDALTYAVFSNRKTATVFDPIQGVYKTLAAEHLKSEEGKLTWRAIKTGLQLSGMIGYDRASTMKVYDEMMLAKMKGTGKILKVVKHPVHTLQELLSIGEMGPRATGLDSAYKALQKKHPDWSAEDCYIALFNERQDITVNFTKSGYVAKHINEVAAFFNVAIRGPEKLYRTLKKRPITTIVKGIAWLSLFAIKNWYDNKDKQWYKNQPYAYKYSNFWFENGNEIIRLPIPFELGTFFASAPMAALDYMETHDPKTVEAIKDMLVKQMPNPTPTGIDPIIDIWKNADYLNIPIESEGMQYIPVEERTREHTMPISIALSKGFNQLGIKMSPVQVEYLFNQYTGGFVRQLPLRPILSTPDVPILGEVLLRMPEHPKRQLNELYYDFEMLTQKKNVKTATREERAKLQKIKPIVNLFNERYSKLLKKYREEKDIEKLKALYIKMGELMKKFGYD